MTSLVICVFGIVIVLLFLPYFHSLKGWHSQETVAFEGDSITLPRRWVPADDGHLLSLKKPGIAIMLSHDSMIVVDPFAERWPAENLKRVSDLWLKSHGSSVEGKFEDEPTGKSVMFSADMKCVSPAPASEREFIRIYCLSLDSVHSFEFFGGRNAVSDFADVSAQALRIARNHPGVVLRK